MLTVNWRHSGTQAFAPDKVRAKIRAASRVGSSAPGQLCHTTDDRHASCRVSSRTAARRYRLARFRKHA